MPERRPVLVVRDVINLETHVDRRFPALLASSGPCRAVEDPRCPATARVRCRDPARGAARREHFASLYRACERAKQERAGGRAGAAGAGEFRFPTFVETSDLDFLASPSRVASPRSFQAPPSPTPPPAAATRDCMPRTADLPSRRAGRGGRAGGARRRVVGAAAARGAGSGWRARRLARGNLLSVACARGCAGQRHRTA